MAVSSQPMLTLSFEETDRLLAVEDGDAALVFLHCRRTGRPWPDSVPGLDQPRLAAARRKLAEAGLICQPSPVPRCGAGEIAGSMLTSPDFVHVLRQAERILGKTLSSSDTQILHSIYDWRGFPPGVILLLINCCADDCARKYGPGKPPTVRQIDREAAVWQDRGIVTEKDAEEYIHRREEERLAAAGAYRALGISGREPSATEQKYVASWTGMGMSPEMIAEAYDKTVLATGRLVWKYCDTILRRWSERGFATPADIERGDRRQEPGDGGAGRATGGLDDARAVLARMKGETHGP